MKPRPTLLDEEWIFDSVTEKEADAAFMYELARCSNRVRQGVESAQAHIQSGGDPNGLPLTLLNEFAKQNPDFPTPWVRRTGTSRAVSAGGLFSSRGMLVGLQLVEPNKRTAGPIFESLKGGYLRDRKSCLVWLSPDDKTPKVELMRQFEKWLDSALEGRALKRGRGGVVTPWAKLKGVAAFRLSSADYSYDKAQDFVDRSAQRKKLSAEAIKRVLPQYADKSDWHAAIRETEASIASLERDFQCGPNLNS